MVRPLFGLPLLLCAFTALAQRVPATIDVSYKNVSFSLEHSLARTYAVDSVAENPAGEKPGAGAQAVPGHLVFTLRDTYVRDRENLPELETVPRILVIPVARAADEQFAAAYPELRETVEQLRQMLGRRTTWGKVPFFPGDGAKEEFVARRKLMRFRNGKGFAFLTQFSAPNEPLTNDRLLYVFVGLTDDFKWFVSMVFPIEALGLPGHAHDVVIDQPFDVYLHETVDRIEKLQPRTFYPTLMSIENVIRSLKVTSP
jgi:hypothetical protein